MGFMERMTYDEAWKQFSKVSAAPLVVIVEKTGQSRLLFDGTKSCGPTTKSRSRTVISATLRPTSKAHAPRCTGPGRSSA